MMNCFNSSDPAAVNATLVYDDKIATGDLWSRSSRGGLGPLPPCSSSSTPVASRCTVCVDQLVRVLCSNLTKGAKVTMEAGADQVQISESGCPRLSSDVPSDAPSDAAPQWLLPVVITSILLIIISGVYLYCKCSRSKRRSEERKPGQTSEESSALTDVVTS